MGVDENCVAVGGACTALAPSLGSYYQNPSAIADLKRPLIGVNLRAIDTTHLDLIDSAGSHDIPKTNTKGKYAVAPTLAFYRPIMKNVTVGVGVGAPFAITADWSNTDGIHRYDMSDQSLFILDLAPTIGIKLTDRLSIGASASITAFRHLTTQTLIPDSFGAALPPALGGANTIIPTTPTSPIIGSISLNTNRNFHIGLPPNDMETAFDSVAGVFGLQYRLSDTVTLGLMGRTRTKNSFHGEASLVVGGVSQTSPFSLRLDMPGHIQFGMAARITPKTTVSIDYQRSFWSDAVGFGSPAVIKFSMPLLGFINALKLNYKAHDTSNVHMGVQQELSPRLTVMAGYAFNQSIFPSDAVDILTYDSNRHIFSTGLRYDMRRDQTQSGLILTGSFQWVQYEKRPIATGESANLGGVSLPNLTAPDTLSFTSNRGPFTFGGSIRSLSMAVQYVF
jgi:long-chain fatty acid transport protein